MWMGAGGKRQGVTQSIKFTVIPCGVGTLSLPLLQIQLVCRDCVMYTLPCIQSHVDPPLQHTGVPVFQKAPSELISGKTAEEHHGFKAYTVLLNKQRKINHIIQYHPIPVWKGAFTCGLINFLMQLPYGISVVLEPHKQNLFRSENVFPHMALTAGKVDLYQLWNSFTHFWPPGGGICSPLASGLYLFFLHFFVTWSFCRYVNN